MQLICKFLEIVELFNSDLCMPNPNVLAHLCAPVDSLHVYCIVLFTHQTNQHMKTRGLKRGHPRNVRDDLGELWKGPLMKRFVRQDELETTCLGLRSTMETYSRLMI